MQIKRFATAGLSLAVLGGLAVWGLWPEPVAIDLEELTRGPMAITVEAEGITRVRDPYLVTAPIAGTVLRAPVHIGDAVTRGTTVLAEIRPAEPAFLDARARASAQAAVTEAEAAVRLAEANLARSESALTFTRSEHARNVELAGRGIVSSRALETSQQALDTAEATARAARSELDLAKATLAKAQAQLLTPTAPTGEPAGDCCIRITAPVTGTVLTIEDESARLVQAGAALMTLGDLHDLEIEVDLLSSDAVKVQPGARASIERWGGEPPLEARVRRIDPAAFTDVSALGIEEQRVWLKLDIVTPPENRPGLGDRFRVFAKITIWEAEDVLHVPQSALFREGDSWAVFRAEAGRAVLTPVEIGQMNAMSAEVASGLEAGDLVVTYPGSQIEDGTRIVDRKTLN